MLTERPRRPLYILVGCLILAGCTGPENAQPAAKNRPDAAASKEKPSSESSGSKEGAAPDSSASSADKAAASASVESEPFHPPATLADLDNKVQWEDRAVRIGMKLLEDDLAKSKPLVSVKEALAMKNNGPEDNTKILSALGRLPENGQQSDWSASITRYLLSDMSAVNPILVDTIYEAEVAPMYVCLLIGFDWNFIPFADGDFVEHWQTSADHLCDKITLRRDALWSDGRPITAHDIEYSFRSILNPKIPVLAVKTNADKLRDVVAYDDYTVVFFHRKPWVTNVWNIDFPIIPKHIYEPLYSQLEKITFEELQQQPEYQKYELNPVSGQAYEMVSRTRNQEIIFRRREDWYRQNGKDVRVKPFFEEVRFRIIQDPNTALLALKSGRIDEYEIHQQQWATQTSGSDFYEKNTKSFGTEWTYFYFGWNNNEASAPFFKDRRVRQAMSYTLDYHEMLHTLLYGLCEQCVSITHPGAWYAPKPPLKPYVQDLDKAEALLDEAGWTDSDGDGVRDKLIDGTRVKFEFTIIVINDPERVQLCQMLQNDLSKIGVVCNIQKMEGTRLFDRIHKKDYQAYFAGWGTGTDPDESENIWATKYITTGGGRNDLQYSNPEVDRLFEEGRVEFDEQKRAAIYGKIDKLIYEDQPCTFLYWRNSLWGWSKELRGYRFSPKNPFDFSPGFMSIWKASP